MTDRVRRYRWGTKSFKEGVCRGRNIGWSELQVA